MGNNIVMFFQRAIAMGIPLLFGAAGEIIIEKSGHLNLGIPGIMYVGAISGVIGSFFYENAVGAANIVPVLAVLIPLLCCLVGSALMGLLYSFFTVTLRANQNVTGLTLTTFGIGLGNFFGGSIIKLVKSDIPSINLTATSNVFRASSPFAEKLGWFGEIFLSHGFLAYLAIIMAVVAAVVMRKTRLGLHLRAVGESPATADAAGINVNRYKYLATLTGSMIAGLGGLYYIMDYANGVWSNNGFGDRGWMAIALVIFTIWRTDLAIPGAFLFGGLLIVGGYIPGLSGKAELELVNMLPYVVTILVLILVSIRKKREHQPPAALGLSYFREER